MFRGQDYGGHDSSFHDNVVYHDHGDGQNCVNAGTFLPGHGVGWYNNKCVVTDSKNIGTTGGCDCPGSGKPGPGGGQAPQGECGLTMQRCNQRPCCAAYIAIGLLVCNAPMGLQPHVYA